MCTRIAVADIAFAGFTNKANWTDALVSNVSIDTMTSILADLLGTIWVGHIAEIDEGAARVATV